MIGDNALKLIASANHRPKAARALISTEYRTPQLGEIPSPDNSFFYTEGQCKIAFAPRSCRGKYYDKKRWFLLALDFGNPDYIRFGSYEDLMERAETDPFVQFVVDMTNIKPEYIELVRTYPNTRFNIGFDFIKYAQRVRERGGKVILDSFKEELYE